MAFGDTLRHAYQQATDLQRASSARVATGLDWVGKQTDAVVKQTQALAREFEQDARAGADWLSQKTDQAIQQAQARAAALAAEAQRQARELAAKAKAAAAQAAAAAAQAAEAAKAKARSTAQAAQTVYRKAEKAVADKVAAAVTTTCDYAEQARKAVVRTYEQGLDNAAAQTRSGKGETWEAKGKAGAEADRRDDRNYGSAAQPNAWEPKVEAKLQRSSQQSLLMYGDDDTNIQVGSRKLAGAVGYEHDFGGNREVFGVYGEAQVAGLTGQAKGAAFSNLVEGTAQGEVLSAKAGGMFGYLHDASFQGLKAEVGAEANLIKGGLSGQLNITPKTLYDNSLGKAVGYFNPDWGQLPAWTDHGLFVGAEVEAGIGAAAKASAVLDAQKMSVEAGLQLGAGPMAGIYAIFGIK